jgi:hypothetical protein
MANPLPIMGPLDGWLALHIANTIQDDRVRYEASLYGSQWAPRTRVPSSANIYGQASGQAPTYVRAPSGQSARNASFYRLNEQSRRVANRQIVARD